MGNAESGEQGSSTSFSDTFFKTTYAPDAAASSARPGKRVSLDNPAATSAAVTATLGAGNQWEEEDDDDADGDIEIGGGAGDDDGEGNEDGGMVLPPPPPDSDDDDDDDDDDDNGGALPVTANQLLSLAFDEDGDDDDDDDKDATAIPSQSPFNVHSNVNDRHETTKEAYDDDDDAAAAAAAAAGEQVEDGDEVGFDMAASSSMFIDSVRKQQQQQQQQQEGKKKAKAKTAASAGNDQDGDDDGDDDGPFLVTVSSSSSSSSSSPSSSSPCSWLSHWCSDYASSWRGCCFYLCFCYCSVCFCEASSAATNRKKFRQGGNGDGGDNKKKSNNNRWGLLFWELVSGFLTALSVVPMAMAFALVANMKVQEGLTGAWVLMLFVAITGNSPGVIYSNAGATALVVADLAREKGSEFVFAALTVSGAITVVLSLLFNVSKIVNRLLPSSVMIGFLNSVAVAIAIAQFRRFKVLPSDDEDYNLSSNDTNDGKTNKLDHSWVWTSAVEELDEMFDTNDDEGSSSSNDWVQGTELRQMLLIVVVTAGVVLSSPKLCTAFPAPLIGVLVAVGIEYGVVRWWLDAGTQTVEDVSKLPNHRHSSSMNDNDGDNGDDDDNDNDDNAWFVVDGGDSSLFGYDLWSMVPTVVWWPKLTDKEPNSNGSGDDGDDYMYSRMPNLLEWQVLKSVLPTAVSVSVVAIVESLKTVQKVSHSNEVKKAAAVVNGDLDDDSDDDDDGGSTAVFGKRVLPLNLNLESVALGLGTVVVGCFGGQSGSAFIGAQLDQSKAELATPGDSSSSNDNDDENEAGGRGGSSGAIVNSRMGAFTAAVCTFAITNFGSRYLNMVPVSGLVGLMVALSAQHYFNWQSIKTVTASLAPFHYVCGCCGSADSWVNTHKINRTDALAIFVVTFGGPLCGNLAVGLLAGCGLCVVGFALDTADRLTVEVLTYPTQKNKNKNKKVYVVTGQVYFGSVSTFLASFDVANDPRTVELRLSGADVCDVSGVKALNQLAATYKMMGKQMNITGVSRSSVQVLSQASGLLTAFTDGGAASSFSSSSSRQRRRQQRSLLVSGLKSNGAIGTAEGGGGSLSDGDDDEGGDAAARLRAFRGVVK